MKPRILLIEYNLEAQKALDRVLETEYEVVKARDGVVGFDKLLLYLPDLVILDIQMPSGNGLLFIELMKLKPEVKQTPLIVLGTKTISADWQVGLKKGTYSHLVKPVAPDTVNDMVEVLLLSNPPVQRNRPSYNQVLKDEIREFKHQEENKITHIQWFE